MSKKKNDDGIYFIGNNAVDVTGSMTLVKFCGKNILLECGMVQGNDYLKNYKANSEKFQFNPKEIDYCFVLHAHIDHTGMLARLVKEGFKGKIITSDETSAFLEVLLLNSAFILGSEARVISKRYKREYLPLYEEDDVYRMLDFVYEYDDVDVVHKLDDVVSFRFIDNSHCLGARQLQLILTGLNGKTRKILYTSDIGSFRNNNHYMRRNHLETSYNDVMILESTYGERTRGVKSSRKKDLQLIKETIDKTMARGGTVIFPAFSYSRTQELAATLHDIYGDDKNFKYHVYVDSKLSCDVSDIYRHVLKDEARKEWNRVCNWDNLSFISEKEDSNIILSNPTPKIIIVSSGFCTNGRVLHYLAKYISDKNSAVVFSGYAGADPSYISYRIKNKDIFKEIKFPSIELPVKNEAETIVLTSFSSHAPRTDLIKYGSRANCEKIVLVHGSVKARTELQEDIKDEVSKQDKTTSVIVSNKGMMVKL